MNDPYAYWRAALAIAGDGGKLTKAQVAEAGGITTEPRAGFWMKRETEVVDGKRLHKAPRPVAIWPTEDGYAALVDGHPADPDEIWSYVATAPLTEETYRAVAERREWWPEGIKP